MISAFFNAMPATGSFATRAEMTFSELFTRLVQQMDILHRPSDLLQLALDLSFFHAAVAVVVGVLCVLNGYQWHRWVVVILAFGAGYIAGMLLASRMGESMIVAISLGLLCAIVATPLLKWAVAMFAGLAGAFIGANIWSALETVPDNLSWAGAGMGFIALALVSFILFRISIVLFTAVGGAAMIVLGGITILLQIDSWRQPIMDGLTGNHLLLPLLVAVAAAAGFVLQETRSRAKPAEEA